MVELQVGAELGLEPGTGSGFEVGIVFEVELWIDAAAGVAFGVGT